MQILVIAVPDSGIPAAIGYAKASGIPYDTGFIKNRYVGRTFIITISRNKRKSSSCEIKSIKGKFRRQESYTY